MEPQRDSPLRARDRAVEPPELDDGTILDKRYEITGAVGRTPFGELYRAVDREQARVVAVHTLRADLLAAPGAAKRLYAEVSKKAVKLDHKNIVKSGGLITGDGIVAVVTQHVAGQTLREIIEERAGAPAERRAPFSVKGAYNVIAHLANALDYAHHVTFHGALTASEVLVNHAGRIKVRGFGLAATFPRALVAVEAIDRATLAPEMLQTPDVADGRCDVYALGALLFELLTGHGYQEGTLLREHVPSLPTELEGIVARMVGAPEERPAPLEIKTALATVLDAMPRSEMSGKFAAYQGSTGQTVPAKAKAKVKAPPPPMDEPDTAPTQLVSSVDPHESRFIVRKGKLDFGPFTLAQVKEQIAVDEAVPGNLLLDTETGHSEDIAHHSLLADLVAHAAHRRDDARRANVEATVVKQDKRRGAALYGFIGAAAVALAASGYALSRVLGAGGERKEKETTLLAGADLAGLKLGSARHVEAEPARPRGGGGGGGGGSQAPGKAGSWDDSQSMEMGGDAPTGDERLDDQVITGVITSHAGGLARCLNEEAGRGGVRHADVEFIVLGTGKVSAVRVNGETSGTLANCIRGVMLGMPFPKFNGPRTRASFPISI